MCCISCMCVCVHAGTLNDSVCMDCSLPTVKFMISRIMSIGDQLNDLHGFGRVYQAVHLDYVLVCEGEWELADTHKAVRMDSSLEKSM